MLKAAIVVGAQIVYYDHKRNTIEIAYGILAGEVLPRNVDESDL